jgi:hypothetical protein
VENDLLMSMMMQMPSQTMDNNIKAKITTIAKSAVT